MAFGLKLLYGDHVHVFFGEPTQSPCMLLGLYSGLHEQISVQDIGLDNRTAADGLAVGRPSGFVGKLIEPLLSGCYTVEDDTLYALLHMLAASESKYLEPLLLPACSDRFSSFRLKKEDAIVRNIRWNMPYMSSGEREEAWFQKKKWLRITELVRIC